MFSKHPWLYVLPLVVLYCLLMQSCSSTRYVPEGEYLLASTSIKCDVKGISTWEMESYINQKPNYKTFSIFKLPLTLYNLSGSDTTKWLNRVLRNAGDPPVIYDSSKVEKTVLDLQRMMTNKGYLNTEVFPVIDLKKKKAKITYDIKGGDPYRIGDYRIEINDSIIQGQNLSLVTDRRLGGFKQDVSSVLDIDSILYSNTLVRKGGTFDLDMLDQERDRITTVLRRSGYYRFNKEYIGFVADTTDLDKNVDLEMTIYPYSYRGQTGEVSDMAHHQYEVKEVELYVDYNPVVDGDISKYPTTSVYEKEGYKIYYGPRGEYIKPSVLLNSCYIRPGALYNEARTTITYGALSQLRILKNVNITFTEIWENDSTKLRCTITCVPDKKQGITTDLEGTNSGSFFGLGAGLGYRHRNLFRGSEVFNINLRGAYEAITPNFSKFDDNYFEISGETSLTFPRFIFPFVSKDFQRRLQASTQFAGSYTYQRRPGFFTRTILSSGVKYIWQDRRRPFMRHAFDLVDVSYVRVPSGDMSDEFKESLSPAALKYSFTDQFILGTGYTYTNTNLGSSQKRSLQPIYSLRASVETAGNTLALISKLANIQSDSDGAKEIFGTKFVQYVRGTVDYSKTYIFDDKNSFAWRLGGGLAFPYGNYKQIPIQKRFFAGGANSVRGWSVRELGPGSLYNDTRRNFYVHSGDIRFDANVEYRSKIFWVFELAAFVDAGNVWTIDKYEDQPGGVFQLNSFYKEIAVAWGLGLRLDLSFALIRLDLGWRAYDPTSDPKRRRWPITEPHKIAKNTAFHIGIGYPF